MSILDIGLGCLNKAFGGRLSPQEALNWPGQAAILPLCQERTLVTGNNELVEFGHPKWFTSCVDDFCFVIEKHTLHCHEFIFDQSKAGSPRPLKLIENPILLRRTTTVRHSSCRPVPSCCRSAREGRACRSPPSRR